MEINNRIIFFSLLTLNIKLLGNRRLANYRYKISKLPISQRIFRIKIVTNVKFLVTKITKKINALDKFKLIKFLIIKKARKMKALIIIQIFKRIIKFV